MIKVLFLYVMYIIFNFVILFQTFAERAMKPVLWFVSVCVALSALGSCIGSYLISSR